MDTNFKNDLDHLSEKSENVTRVLKNSKESFEKYFDEGFKDDYSCLNVNTFPDLRLDNLDKLLTRLRSTLKLTSPCVDQANELVSKLNLLNTNVALIKEKMKNVSVSSDFLQLCDMEELINDNYARLKCVEKLQVHLDPHMFKYINVNQELDEDDYQEFVKIIQSAEKLKLSRKLCHSLKNIQELSESLSLAGALKKIDANFDLASQMCYMWLTKQTQKISVLSARHSSDSGIINEPLINVSDKDDKIGIISIFETSSTDPNYSMDHLIVPETPRYGFGESDSKETQQAVMDDRNLSLRILKILITNPKSLQKILNDLNLFLSNLSFRRLASLLKYIKLDLKYKNNAIYDVFMNLQLVLSLIKSCVLSLYHNCELDLYVNPYPDLDIMTAPNYIDKITIGLVPPLEHKLDQILNMSLGNDANMYNNTNMDIDMNLELDLEQERQPQRESGMGPGLDTTSSYNRYNNDNQTNLDMNNENDTRKDRQDKDKESKNKDTNRNNNKNNSDKDNNNHQKDRDNWEENKRYEDIYVSDILDIYTALQICHFYYKKLSKILKPPYLFPHSPSTDRDTDHEFTDTGYVVENNPILLSFSGLCEKWKDIILTKLQQNITYPLSNNEFSKKLDSYQVVETVSNFLSEIVSIQLEYSSSDDLLMILEMTLNPVINWCQKVSNELGEESHYFLIRSFSSLLNSIQSPQVNKSFKSLLEDLMDMSAEAVSVELVGYVVSSLGGGNLVDYSTFNVEFTNEDFLEKIRGVVYTDSLKEHLSQRLANLLSSLGTTNYKLVARRVYLFLAGVYKQHSKDSQLTDDLFTLVSTYE